MNLFDDLLRYRNILSSLNPAKKSYVIVEGSSIYILQDEKLYDISVMNRYVKYKFKSHRRRRRIVGILFSMYVDRVIFEMDNLIFNAYSNIDPPIIAYPGDNYEVIVSSSSSAAPCKDILRINLAPFSAFKLFLKWKKI